MSDLTVVYDACVLYPAASEVVCAAAKRQRQSLKKPPLSVEEYLSSLERQGLGQTVSRLRGYAELI